MREIVKIRQMYNYFNINKLWIISLLYICAIVKDFIWYSVFGINILNFISIQDTFTSFFSHTMIIVVLTLNFLLFQILFSRSKKTATTQIIKILLILGTSVLYFFMFKKILSLLSMLTIIIIVYSLYFDKKYGQILSFSILFLIIFSTIEPLTQAFILKMNEEKNIRQFKWNESNMDLYSFEYENILIDTSIEKYFLVGSNKDYFFVFDKFLNKTLIIPKSECINIKAEFDIFR